ncbi:hypothetical protein MMC07_008649 [Pseudocyphellaria aurata]|nr:hypothetical protein [Pseudocyphellaria aurata]
MSFNPTVVLVTGAFHVSSVMHLLSGKLQQAGYSTRSMGLKTPGNSGLSIDHDATALKTELLDLLIEQQGKHVVLYLHSYAGFPGSAAIRGLSQQERAAQGKKGGIIGLIYQSAFIPKEGQTLIDMLGGSYAPWQSPDYETGLVNVIDSKQIFYADVPDPLASVATTQVCGQPIVSMNTPSGPIYYADEGYLGRRLYIHTELDQALPPFAQDLFVASSEVERHVKKLNSGHSPFLSDSTTLASVIQEYIQTFEEISRNTQ